MKLDIKMLPFEKGLNKINIFYLKQHILLDRFPFNSIASEHSDCLVILQFNRFNQILIHKK